MYVYIYTYIICLIYIYVEDLFCCFALFARVLSLPTLLLYREDEED